MASFLLDQINKINFLLVKGRSSQISPFSLRKVECGSNYGHHTLKYLNLCLLIYESDFLFTTGELQLISSRTKSSRFWRQKGGRTMLFLKKKACLKLNFNTYLILCGNWECFVISTHKILILYIFSLQNTQISCTFVSLCIVFSQSIQCLRGVKTEFKKFLYTTTLLFIL